MELADVCKEGTLGLHIYTAGAQLGRKQIFEDHGIVLSLSVFRRHASCTLKIVRVVTIRGELFLKMSIKATILFIFTNLLFGCKT